MLILLTLCRSNGVEVISIRRAVLARVLIILACVLNAAISRPRLSFYYEVLAGQTQVIFVDFHFN